MFYKHEPGGWMSCSVVKLPTGEILNEENKISLDGWEWHDEPPQEYIDWQESQINNSL